MLCSYQILNNTNSDSLYTKTTKKTVLSLASGLFFDF